eukprot:2662702-Amphidinium_carterae.1
MLLLLAMVQPKHGSAATFQGKMLFRTLALIQQMVVLKLHGGEDMSQYKTLCTKTQTVMVLLIRSNPCSSSGMKQPRCTTESLSMTGLRGLLCLT